MISGQELHALMGAILEREISDPAEWDGNGDDPGPVRDQVAALIERWDLPPSDAATLWRLVAGEWTFPVTIKWSVSL